MNKAQLVERITDLESRIANLTDVIAEQETMADDFECVLHTLESRLGKAPKAKGDSRRRQVLNYLLDNGHCKIGDIAKALSTTPTNVSSYLAYLRKAKCPIATDSRGYKFLEDDERALEMLNDPKI
ncbi:MAG: ArsR family transcriptional regulator [Tenuifilaceae bacterium]|jgi:DNA-binding MarR family transcriptional regulator|nr:ArsR family transcriptional regulator [Tenuifilaceae bacterium]